MLKSGEQWTSGSRESDCRYASIGDVAVEYEACVVMDAMLSVVCATAVCGTCMVV